MSDDALEAVARALAQNKRHAASLLVKKEDVEAELAKALAAGDDARIQALTADLAAAKADLAAALKEIDELKKLGARARAGAPVSLGDSDPLIRSDEEIALDNARAAIADRHAEARLGEADTDPAVVPAPALSPEEEARKKFEELRAARTTPPKKSF